MPVDLFEQRGIMFREPVDLWADYEEPKDLFAEQEEEREPIDLFAKQPLPTLGQRAKDVGMEALDILGGVVETPATLISGVVGFIGGTIAGLGEPLQEFMQTGKITTESLAVARREQEKIMEFMIYKPRTKAGKATTELLTLPFTEAHRAIEESLANKSPEEIDSAKFLFDVALLAVPKFAKSIQGKRLAKTSPKAAEMAKKAKPQEAVREVLPTVEKAPETILDPMFGEVGALDISKIMAEPTSKGAKVMDLIKDRRANTDIATLRSEKFLRDIELELTLLEREAIPFVIQGIKDPGILKSIGREDLMPLVRNPSQKLRKSAGEISKYYDEGFDFLKEHFGDDIGYIENYVTQIWDIPKQARERAFSQFATYNPFLKKRKIPTFAEGITQGLVPKTLDIVELLRTYDQYKIRTVFNQKFANQITEMVSETGEKLVQRVDKAPVGWVTNSHPALSRAMAIGRIGKEGVLLKKVPVKVHPEIAREMEIVFGERFRHPIITAFEVINAFLKKSMLTASLFHHFALSESGASSGMLRRTAKYMYHYTPMGWPKLYKTIKNKNYDIFNKMPVAEDAIRHTVKFGALPDVQLGIVQKALKDVEFKTRKLPIAKHLTKGFRKVNDLWDAALWDFVHNNFKLNAYETQVMIELKQQKPKTQVEIDSIKDQIGGFVNDSFGGQNWDLHRILGTPKMQQMMQWFWLAPDWTISVLRQAAAPVRGVLKGQKALAKRGSLFWLRAALYYNIIAQSVNLYNSQKYLGEARFTYQNDPGHELNIFAGYNDDGTKRYIRMGKQFREVWEWGLDPINKMGAKASPLAREIMRQYTKHDPGSGFPTKWDDKEFWESIPERALSILEMPLPFSLRPYIEDRPQMFMFALPASRGMTNYKTIKYFKRALEAKDINRVRHVYVSALENGLDAQQLFKSAASSLKADMTYDNKQLAKDIYMELEQLPPEAKKDTVDVYRQKGVLTPEIEDQLMWWFERKGRVKEQQRVLGIEER